MVLRECPLLRRKRMHRSVPARPQPGWTEREFPAAGRSTCNGKKNNWQTGDLVFHDV